jgi:hypothetical protein
MAALGTGIAAEEANREFDVGFAEQTVSKGSNQITVHMRQHDLLHAGDAIAVGLDTREILSVTPSGGRRLDSAEDAPTFGRLLRDMFFPSTVFRRLEAQDVVVTVTPPFEHDIPWHAGVYKKATPAAKNVQVDSAPKPTYKESFETRAPPFQSSIPSSNIWDGAISGSEGNILGGVLVALAVCSICLCFGVAIVCILSRNKAHYGHGYGYGQPYMQEDGYPLMNPY